MERQDNENMGRRDCEKVESSEKYENNELELARLAILCSFVCSIFVLLALVFITYILRPDPKVEPSAPTSKTSAQVGIVINPDFKHTKKQLSPVEEYRMYNLSGPTKGNAEPIKGYADHSDYLVPVETTAYWTHDPIQASGTGLAADGKPAVAYRTIAVDPNVIPMQSEVYIPEIGWCIAHDTGGAVKGNIVDIAMPSREHAFEWGRRDALILVRPPVK